MAQIPDTESLFALLEDADLRELLRSSTHECLTWEGFLRMRLPQGISAMDTWELLADLHRASAIYFPIDDVAEWAYWYTPTQRINATLSQIQCLSRRDSPLYKAVSESSGQQFLVQSRIDEAVASVQLDGLMTPPGQAREMLSLDRAPRTANEQLIHNTISLQNRLDDYVDQRFSPELLRHLHDEVLQGITVDELKMTERRQGLGQETFSEELLTRHADRQTKRICDYANGDTGDSFDNPVVRALIIKESIRGYRSLPVASGAVARLAFSLYALKNELPLLAVLPISKTSLEWETGRVTIPHFDAHVTSFAHPRHNEYDLTPYVTIATYLTLEALRDLRADIKRRTMRDDEIRSALQEDTLLNHRQRSILGRASRNPEAEFRIRYHKTKHNIAYATARADLMKLTEMGYLVQQQHGKAFVFVPHPDLKSRLSTSE